MVNAIAWAIGVIFGAGIGWATLRRMRKDQNGMGGKITRLERLENERYSAICLAILTAVPEEKRGQVAGLLKIGATL